MLDSGLKCLSLIKNNQLNEHTHTHTHTHTPLKKFAFMLWWETVIKQEKASFYICPFLFVLIMASFKGMILQPLLRLPNADFVTSAQTEWQTV